MGMPMTNGDYSMATLRECMEFQVHPDRGCRSFFSIHLSKRKVCLHRHGPGCFLARTETPPVGVLLESF